MAQNHLPGRVGARLLHFLLRSLAFKSVNGSCIFGVGENETMLHVTIVRCLPPTRR